MKQFRSFPELRREIEETLAGSKPAFHHSPLEDVAQLLCAGRRYAWVGIYLTVTASGPQPLLEAGADLLSRGSSGARSRILLSMKRGIRETGLLDVETDRPNGFTAAEVAFLGEVADMLANYLSGRGKYLVRRTRRANQELRASSPVQP